LRRGCGDVIIHGPVTQEVEDVFRKALSTALDLADLGEYAPPSHRQDIILHFEVAGGDLPVGGESYGLALALVLATEFAGRTLSEALAITGSLGENGTVLGVAGCPRKVASSRTLGFGRIMLPASQLDMFASVDQIPVATVYEAWSVVSYA
jgi:predicted ATP-dependent serine protease